MSGLPSSPFLSSAVVESAERSNLSGGPNETLQAMQSSSSVRGVSSLKEVSRWTEDSVQNLHKETTAGEDEARKKRPPHPREKSCANAAADCCTMGPCFEARPLSGMSGSDAETPSGWTPQRLFETASGNLALPELSRGRTSGLAAESGIAETPAGSAAPIEDDTSHIGEIFVGARKLEDPDEHRFVLDEQAFMEAIEPLPLFLQITA